VKGASREELLWRDEQLRNADLDVDEPFRRSIERSRRLTEDHAARCVFSDNNTKRRIGRLQELMEFLFRPAAELTDEELGFRIELLEDRGKSARYLASLLRIYTPGVWYELSCDYLKRFVVPSWKTFKKSKARKKEKRG
jgi:hypothetical protein